MRPVRAHDEVEATEYEAKSPHDIETATSNYGWQLGALHSNLGGSQSPVNDCARSFLGADFNCEQALTHRGDTELVGLGNVRLEDARRCL